MCPQGTINSTHFIKFHRWLFINYGTQKEVWGGGVGRLVLKIDTNYKVNGNFGVTGRRGCELNFLFWAKLV